MKKEIVKKDEEEKIFRKQSKLPFNGIQEPFAQYDSYSFKQKEALMDITF